MTNFSEQGEHIPIHPENKTLEGLSGTRWRSLSEAQEAVGKDSWIMSLDRLPGDL